MQDVECRLVSLEHKGEHLTRKLCEPAPREKCVPVPFKVSGNKSLRRRLNEGLRRFHNHGEGPF